MVAALSSRTRPSLPENCCRSITNTTTWPVLFGSLTCVSTLNTIIFKCVFRCLIINIHIHIDGFHKITSIDNGGLKFDKDEMEFSHPCFQKDHPFLLEHIKRKIANPKQPASVATATLPPVEDKATIKPEVVNKVMNDVKVMRSRQETLDSRFSAMKQENEALWREVAILRQKHVKQQQIVNKLIQFLVTLVQPARGGGGINNMSGVKRRFQLMINDVPESSKSRKGNDDSVPVIQELTEDLFDQVDYDYCDDDDVASPNVMSPPEDLKSHESRTESVSSPNYGETNSSNTVVDHPESDEEQMETSDFNDKINNIIHEITPTTAMASSPTQEWLEKNVLSPQQIKQEEVDEPFSIRSIHENYGREMERTHPYLRTYSKRNKAAQPQGTSLLQSKKPTTGLHLKITNNNHARKMPTSVKPGSSSAPQGQQRSSTATSNATPIGGKMISGLNAPSPGKLASSTSGSKQISTITQKPVTARLAALPKPTNTAKGYTNKSDFISTEMPSELFDSPDSNAGSSNNAGSLSVSPMLGDQSSASYNPTLSEDYSKKIFPVINNSNSTAAATSSSGSGGKNMAVTMYNKGNGKLTTA